MGKGVTPRGSIWVIVALTPSHRHQGNHCCPKATTSRGQTFAASETCARHPARGDRPCPGSTRLPVLRRTVARMPVPDRLKGWQTPEVSPLPCVNACRTLGGQSPKVSNLIIFSIRGRRDGTWRPAKVFDRCRSRSTLRLIFRIQLQERSPHRPRPRSRVSWPTLLRCLL